jgi:RNA polymerase sigma-70 factor (ECF subfamily)
MLVGRLESALPYSLCDQFSRSHTFTQYRMTQITGLPLPTDEPRADALLFPEARAMQMRVDASGNSPILQGTVQPFDTSAELDSKSREPVRRSGMVTRDPDETPSSSRLVAVRQPVNSAAAATDRLVLLVREQSRNVWRTLRRLGVPTDLLDDATQDVFIIASRKLDSIEAGVERSFLYGTALRVAANLRRSCQARRCDPLDEHTNLPWQNAPDTEQLVHRKQLRELLDQILDKMPDDLREVFVLFELEKLTRSELADLLGLPAGTIASRLRRARELFEDACEKLREFPEGGPR